MRIYAGPALDWHDHGPDVTLVYVDVDEDGLHQTLEYADGSTSERVHIGGRDGLDPRILRLVDDAERESEAA